jgi:membrane fusion protein, multidrug efflux system
VTPSQLTRYATTTVGCAILLAMSACSKEPAGAGGGGFGAFVMAVEVAVAQTRPVVDRFEAVGTIEADAEITVVSEIDGIVTSIPFGEGSPIEKGDLIAQLQDDQLRAELARAAALRDQGQSTFERVQSVVDQGAGTPQDLDDARAELEVAKADLALARSRLDKATIRAPFSGIAGSRQVSPGAFLRAGQAITDLADIAELRVVFSAPERYLGKLHRGARVTISTSAWPEISLSGTIDIIEPVLDEATRSVRVIARAANRDELFRPGMSANIVATLSSRENALTIPSESVFVDGNQAYVFRVQSDSTVTRTPLSLGTRLSDVVEVLGGIDEGSTVVRAGHQKLFEGAKVNPIQSQKAGAGR